MIVLVPTRLRWFINADGTFEDPCSLSPIDFRLDNDVLVSPEDGEWSVNITALYLLRTLTGNHEPHSRVGEHMLCCCGFEMTDCGAEKNVHIDECPAGRNFWVRRCGADIELTTERGTQFRVPFIDWRDAVCAFSDSVRAFYDKNPPQRPTNTELRYPTTRAGYDRFMDEWTRRRREADSIA